MMPIPEVIQAIGVAVAAILTAWQAHTSAKVRDLEHRLASVERERNELRTIFRVAVRHIRDWMSWARNHVPGTPPPPLPDELRDEV